MVEQQEFQIPQQLRELAEKSVEQARLAYGQFLDGMAEALRAWSTVPSASVWVQSRSGASDSIRKGKLRRWFRVGKRAGQS